MGIRMHNLEFNVGTSSIHQLPQTTGDGIHSLLQEVMWNVGDNFPNLVLQLFQCVRFCPVHLLLSPAPQEKVTGREIWTSCRPFMRSSSSQPTSRKLLIQPGTYAQCQVWWWAIVQEYKFIDIFPARNDRPHVIFQHLKIAFGIHGVTQKIWADDPSGRHSAPHGHFWTIFASSPPSLRDLVPPSNGNYVDGRNRRYGKRPRRSRECFRRVLANPRANPAPTPHIPFCGHSLQVSAPARNEVSVGENSSLSLTP